MAATGLLHVFFTSLLLILMIFAGFISYMQLTLIQTQAYQDLVKNVAQGVATQISEIASLAKSNGSFMYVELTLPYSQTPYKVWLTTRNNITYVNAQIEKGFINATIPLLGNIIESNTAVQKNLTSPTQINSLLNSYNLKAQQQIYMGQKAYLWLMVIVKNVSVSSVLYQYTYYVVGFATGVS